MIKNWEGLSLTAKCADVNLYILTNYDNTNNTCFSFSFMFPLETFIYFLWRLQICSTILPEKKTKLARPARNKVP